MNIDSHHHFWKKELSYGRMDQPVDVCDTKRFSLNRFGIFFHEDRVDV